MTMTMGMLATAAKNSSHSAAEKLTHAESGNSNVKKQIQICLPSGLPHKYSLGSC